MAEKVRLRPQPTDAEADAALARAYALLIRAGERATQAGIQDQDGDSDEYRDGRKIRDRKMSTRT